MVEHGYQVTYFCQNCARHVKKEFRFGDRAPRLVKCPICGCEGAEKCNWGVNDG